MKLIPHTLDFPGPFSFPTSCGGTLIFSDFGVLIRYTLASFRQNGGEDVVEATTYVTDKDGQTWQCVVHFCASQFLEFFYSIKSETVDFNESTDDTQENHGTSALRKENLLLEHVSFCDDSREYRHFHVAGEWRNVFAKYLGCQFSIGHFIGALGTSNQPCSDLVIRLSAHLFQRYVEDCERDLEVDIVTKINPQKILFLNTAQEVRTEMPSGEIRDCWDESPIPLPIMFSRTTLPGETQDAVSFYEKTVSIAPGIEVNQN